MVKIVDCSIGFNEIDLFEIRSAELRNVTDYIVIVEANKTHSGVPKPVMFESAAKSSDAKGAEILHYLIEDMPEIYFDSPSNRFVLEMFQRNCMIRALSKLNLNDDDIVLISDVDEIPKASAVKSLPEILENTKIVIFEQTMLRFFANNISDIHYNRWPWLGTVACRYGLLRTILPQTARIGDQISPRAACVAWGYDRELYPYEKRIYDAGWHLTSMGGAAAYAEKMSVVSEGIASAQNTYTKPLRGRHNFREFRSVNIVSLTNFTDEFCPSLAPVSLNNSAMLNSLNLPSHLTSNMKDLNHFFYFSDCID